MRRAVAAAVLALAGGLFVRVDAAAPVRTGWWERPAGGVVPAPPPAEVPDGGLRVALAPDGPTAISALRYELGAGRVAERLVLTVEGSRGGSPGIVACPPEAGWQPARAGAMADAPTADCDAGSVDGAPGADGTWTFDVSSLATGPVLDVVLVPAGAGAPVTAGGFDLVFAAPAADSLAVRVVERDPPPTVPSTAAPPPAPPPTTTSRPRVPSRPPVSRPAPSAVAPTTTLAEVAAPVPARPTPSVPPPVAALADPRERPQALGLGLMVVGAGALAATLLANPTRLAWALGGTRRSVDDGDSTVAGLDRWAKPRQGDPPPI